MQSSENIENNVLKIINPIQKDKDKLECLIKDLINQVNKEKVDKKRIK